MHAGREAALNEMDRRIRQSFRRRAYWRRFVHYEDRREASEMNEAALVPPAPGFRLIALQRFESDTRIYNRGCEVDIADFSRMKNARAMMACKPPFCEWRTGNSAIFVKPIDKPPPAPPPPKPVAEIVADDDPVTSWFASVKRLTDAGIPRATAVDMLLGLPNRVGSSLYQDAVRIAVAREKQKRGLGTYQSLTPNQVGF
jgi:hypothetical protein